MTPQQEALSLIADLAEGSTTANSLQHIAKIAREALAKEQEPFTEWLTCPKCSHKSPYSPIKAKTLAEDAERITKQARAPLEADRAALTDRENSLIRFALHRFMTAAYAQLSEAAQDKNNSHYKAGAVEAFAKDAKNAEALLAKLPAAHGIKGDA